MQNKSLQQVEWVSRSALVIVFFWFGFLKFFGVSPANQLVSDLLHVTFPMIPFDAFIYFLGAWEVAIAILFLFPKLTKWAFGLMMFQMFTTFGPLLFLPETSWQTFLLVPTLEGQYILKNVVLVAAGYAVFQLYALRKST